MRPIILSLCVVAALPAVAELDLTPRYTSVGGGLVSRVHFADGQKQFAVTLDGETKVSEAEGGALFRFANVPQASMRLRRSPFRQPPAFSSEKLGEYRKAAESLLPKNAEEVLFEAHAVNVLPVNDWSSYRLAFKYRLGGSLYREYVTFLNVDPKQQIVVQTWSYESDFATIAHRADDIVRRWHEVQPGDEFGAN